jgi:hypothetical protein
MGERVLVRNKRGESYAIDEDRFDHKGSAGEGKSWEEAGYKIISMADGRPFEAKGNRSKLEAGEETPPEVLAARAQEADQERAARKRKFEAALSKGASQDEAQAIAQPPSEEEPAETRSARSRS